MPILEIRGNPRRIKYRLECKNGPTLQCTTYTWLLESQRAKFSWNISFSTGLELALDTVVIKWINVQPVFVFLDTVMYILIVIWGLTSWFCPQYVGHNQPLSFSCDESLRIEYELLFFWKYLRTIFFLCNLRIIYTAIFYFESIFQNMFLSLNNFKYFRILILYFCVIGYFLILFKNVVTGFRHHAHMIGTVEILSFWVNYLNHHSTTRSSVHVGFVM